MQIYIFFRTFVHRRVWFAMIPSKKTLNHVRLLVKDSTLMFRCLSPQGSIWTRRKLPCCKRSTSNIRRCLFPTFSTTRMLGLRPITVRHTETCFSLNLFTALENKLELHIVHIYFATSTYDLVRSDVKVTLEGQLGVIGGTMGLFTGFSILSGVEIVYYVAKFILSRLKIRIADSTV